MGYGSITKCSIANDDLYILDGATKKEYKIKNFLSCIYVKHEHCLIQLQEVIMQIAGDYTEELLEYFGKENTDNHLKYKILQLFEEYLDIAYDKETNKLIVYFTPDNKYKGVVPERMWNINLEHKHWYKYLGRVIDEVVFLVDNIHKAIDSHNLAR